MRNLKDRTNVDAPDLEFPYGRTRNEITDGDGTGTKGTEELLQDLLVFPQKLMDDAGITPNELPENETDGYQLMQALEEKVRTTANISGLVAVPAAAINEDWDVIETDGDSKWSALANAECMYSTDGYGWLAGTIDPGYNISSLKYGDGYFVGAASGGRVFRSADGETYTQVNTGFGDNFSDIVWAEELGKFFMCADGSGSPDRVYWSDDAGATWNQESLPENSLSLGAIGYSSDSGRVITGGSNDIYYYSDDEGVNWTKGDLNGSSNIISEMKYGNGKWMCLAGTRLRYSTDDGLTWTDVENNETPQSFSVNKGIQYGGGFWVGVTTSAFARARMAISADGVRWYPIIVDIITWEDLCYNSKHKRFTAVASDGTDKIASIMV